MTDYTDLIARLLLIPTSGIKQKAADALEAQARRIAELETALKGEAGMTDSNALITRLEVIAKRVALDEVKEAAARAALEKKNDGPD